MASSAYLFLALLAVASAKLSAPDNRIVSGDPVTIEEFPYVVSLTYHYPEGLTGTPGGLTVQRCVGSLISSWHVLTAASCFFESDLVAFQVRAGSIYSLSGGTVVNIIHFEEAPGFVMSPRENDIGVAFLEIPLAISDVINIVYLPLQNFLIPENVQTFNIMSWGYEAEDFETQVTTLKAVSLNKISVEACQASFVNDEAVTVTDNVICATAEGKGMCMGDSGAPMVMGRLVLGISSYYSGCDSDVYPDVFTSVSSFTNWIMDVASNTEPPEVEPVPIVMKNVD